jgi:hypothetical protein
MEISGQQQLFQKIKDILPAYRSLADELASVLGVSVDSAYRRIRGETKLTYDEALLLCTHYKISPDVSAGATGGIESVQFAYQHVNTESDFRKYLESMTKSLDQISEAKQGEVVYAGADIPLFHHFRFREHAAFKIYYWLHAVLQSEEYRSRKFNPDVVSEETFRCAQKSLQSYQRITTTEIWSETAIVSSVKQIAYCWEAGLFERMEDALTVATQLADVLKAIQEEAEGPSSVLQNRLYLSETEIGNNCVLVKFPEPARVYLRHQTINTMVTTNEAFCRETDRFLQQLIKRSVLISASAAKQRNQFFRRLMEPVENLIRQIEGSR